MFKLMKLEWRKHQISKYIRNAAIMTLMILVFLIVLSGEMDADKSMELYGKSELIAAVEVVTHMCYIVFTGVMLASFIVGAYEKRTINLMFSYPIKRQKILLSKICAVWIFNFAFLTASKTAAYTILLLTRPMTHISAASIQLESPVFWLNLILGSAAMVSISFISLPVGLKLKSSKAVVVVSVILVCFTQGNIGTYTFVDNAAFYIVLLFVAAIAVILSVFNVEKKDVL